jgi:hypothetical protein
MIFDWAPWAYRPLKIDYWRIAASRQEQPFHNRSLCEGLLKWHALRVERYDQV